MTAPTPRPTREQVDAAPDGQKLDELHRSLARRIGRLRKGSRKLLEISSARNADHVALLDERDRIRDERDEARQIGAAVARQREALLNGRMDGEDVPARLYAAADALTAHGYRDTAADLAGLAGDASDWPADARAAVAAALARPHEREEGESRG